MMLHTAISAFFFLPLIFATPFQNSTNITTSNKPKRTISNQSYSHGDPKAVLFYMENPQTSEVPELQAAASTSGLRNFYPPQANPLALVSVQQPIQVFEQDSPKQVAEQQVLYEFQQTPTNAVSNVHVKQLFQPNNIDITTSNPLYHSQTIDQLPTAQPLSSIHPATSIFTANQHNSRPQSSRLYSGSNHQPFATPTIVSAVHHNIQPNHAVNYAPFNYHNSVVPENQLLQNTNISPKQVSGKYIYLNGKIVFSPTHIIPQTKIPQNSIYHKGVYHNQQKLPLLNYAPRHTASKNLYGQGNLAALHSQHRTKFQEKLPNNLPPITNNGFHPPTQFHTIDKPSVPVQEEEEEDEDRAANEEDDEAEEDDEEGTSEERDNNDQSEYEDDAFEYESFPFEDDDYAEDDESHYFKPLNYRQKKSRGRYLHEENDHEHDDDQRDAKRGASKQTSKYQQYPNHSRKYRNQPIYEVGESYGSYERYSKNSKHKTPKQSKKYGKKYQKPTGKFAKVKFSKVNGGKPKVEKIEGRFSENIPVTHKQKVYKERWYVTKDIEGAANKKIKGL